jgi:hypothetical protein
MNFRWGSYMIVLALILLVFAFLAFGVDSDSSGSKSSGTPTPTAQNLFEVREVVIVTSGLLGTYFTYTKNSL